MSSFTSSSFHNKMSPFCKFTILFTILLLIPAPALASPSHTFLVNSTAETDDHHPGDGICADFAGNCSLRAAIQEANAVAGADIITLPANTYFLTKELPITQDLTINGAGRTLSLIDGTGFINTRGFNISPTIQLALNDLTMQNFPKALVIDGIAANHGVLSLTDCTLRDNTNTDSWNPGSAISNYCEGCTVNLSGTHVYGNSSPACGAIASYGTLVIDGGSQLYSNSATAGRGGAICNESGALTVTGASIHNNASSGEGYDFGGAIFQSSGSMLLSQSQVEDNTAQNLGGGVYVGGGTLSIQGSLLSGNSATTGGGLYIYSQSSTITSTIISQNQAVNGAGIYTWRYLLVQNSSIVSNTASTDGGGIQDGGGMTILVNSTLSGNQANRDGAGIYGSSNPTIKLGSVTVSNNTADADNSGDGMGGGVYLDGEATFIFKNTIIAGNRDLSQGVSATNHPDCYGALTSQGYNLVGKVNAAGCSINGDLKGVQTGSLSPGLDARLSKLTLGGYATYHHPLLVFGPAVDRGNPVGCTDFNGVMLLTDQRGEPRVYGKNINGYIPRCDLGAVESWLRFFNAMLPMVRK
jgi:CSLREA domain-containing protein